MTWNGHEVIRDSAGDNAADWWPFSDLVNGLYEDPFGQLVSRGVICLPGIAET